MRDWRPVGGDERDYDIPDPDDPNIVYGSGLGGRISRWDARTGQVANIAPYLEPNYGERQTTTAHHFVWVTPMAVSRAGPTTLYLGGEVVFASRDKGDALVDHQPGPDRQGRGREATATALSPWPPPGPVATAASGRSTPRRVAPANCGSGTDDGLIQLTRDGGAHWTNVTPPEPAGLGQGIVASIPRRWRTASPMSRSTTTGRAIAARTCWRRATMARPGGTSPATCRPTISSRSCAPNPVRAGLLYAGTDVGAFVSLDDGGHWRALASDLPTAWCNDLLIHGDDLIAATQGRGMWVLDDVAPLRQLDGRPGARDGAPVHAGAAIRVRDAQQPRHAAARRRSRPAENPPGGAVDRLLAGARRPGPVSLEIADASGALVRRLTSAATPRRRPKAYFARRGSVARRRLPTALGAHRAVWDLRQARPAAIQYAYSIAAVAGGDTPIVAAGRRSRRPAATRWL